MNNQLYYVLGILGCFFTNVFYIKPDNLLVSFIGSVIIYFILVFIIKGIIYGYKVFKKVKS